MEPSFFEYKPGDSTKQQLATIRDHLAGNIRLNPSNTKLQEGLLEVDAALDRLAKDRYGLCEVCGTPIGPRTLEVDPLTRHCFSHLSTDAQTKVLWARQMASVLGATELQQTVREIQQLGAIQGALLGSTQSASAAPIPAAESERFEEETFVAGSYPVPAQAPTTLTPEVRPSVLRDIGSWRVFQALKAAWRILLHGQDDLVRGSVLQHDLLPKSHLRLKPWEAYFVYASAGPLGGDYCDLVPAKEGEMFLFFGDVMGKGIPASLFVSRLHALFRTLLDLKLPIAEMFDRANRVFCECARDTGYYATLVCCHASASGALDLINAGHLPPLLLRMDGTERIMATGMPLGMFYSNACEVTHIQLTSGETLLFYTDGVTEARDNSDTEYGGDRLERLASERKHLGPKELVHFCHADVSAYAATAKWGNFSDDITLLALRHL